MPSPSFAGGKPHNFISEFEAGRACLRDILRKATVRIHRHSCSELVLVVQFLLQPRYIRGKLV